MSISVKQVSKSFGSFRALEHVSLEVAGGSLVALLGPSGSGKTTLLRMTAGVEVPDAGTVLYQDEDVTEAAVKDRNVGFVFQHYALFRHMTVFENVAFGLRVRRWPRKRVKERVGELLRLIQLDGLAGSYPSQLSGGQRQRVALARAPAPEPQVPRPGAPARRAAAGDGVRPLARARAAGEAQRAPEPRREGRARQSRGTGGPCARVRSRLRRRAERRRHARPVRGARARGGRHGVRGRTRRARVRAGLHHLSRHFIVAAGRSRAFRRARPGPRRPSPWARRRSTRPRAGRRDGGTTDPRRSRFPVRCANPATSDGSCWPRSRARRRRSRSALCRTRR